ncbi:MAG: hypothetical protein KatS3mg065_0222 [Chloroflexota bacterium]|nr:MAG: hypothetical protein KatS3mg065_0222 [Chloroflexota bacterium]
MTTSGTPSPTAQASPPAPAAVPPRPRIFSGIQPSGVPHLGNDLGAIRNYVRLQDEYEAIYCIVDYHALTSVHDPERLRRQTREMAAALLALGLDPAKCTLFVQSHRPEVTELAWLLATVTPVSWLQRTPTYKEKRQNQPEDVNHGLLTYPVLQAADIVLYKASLVPVGKDQAAHLELSREIVRAFHARYGETFPEPQPVYTEAPVVLGTDGVREDEQVHRQHHRHPRRAGRDPKAGHVDGHRHPADPADRPRAPGGLQRLPAPPLLRAGLRDDLGGRADGPDRLRRHEAAPRRADHRPLRAGPERYLELMARPAEVDAILAAGAERVRPIAEATMAEVRAKMGLRDPANG